MKKTLAIIIFFLCLSLFYGCGNDQYAIEKRFWQAQKQAEKIFKNPSSSPPQQLQKVVSQLNSFAQRFPKHILAIEAEFNIARLYIVKEEYEKARTQLISLINKHQKTPAIVSEALFLLGNSYEIQDKWNLALQEYKKISEQYPLTLRGLNIPVYIAQHYKIKYQPDKMIEALREAIAHYQALSAKYPNTPLALNTDNLVAQCYMAMKDWQSAINTLNGIVKSYQNKVNLDQVLLNIAVIYDQQLKDRTNAIATLQKLIKDYPKSSFIKPATELLKEWKKK